jgi:hypothetical protein
MIVFPALCGLLYLCALSQVLLILNVMGSVMDHVIAILVIIVLMA